MIDKATSEAIDARVAELMQQLWPLSSTQLDLIRRVLAGHPPRPPTATGPSDAG